MYKSRIKEKCMPFLSISLLVTLATVNFKLFKFLCHLSSNTKYNCLDVLQVIIIFGLQQTSDKNSIIGIKTLHYFEITASCMFVISLPKCNEKVKITYNFQTKFQKAGLSKCCGLDNFGSSSGRAL